MAGRYTFIEHRSPELYICIHVYVCTCLCVQRNRLAWPYRRRVLASDGIRYADARSSVGRRFRSATKLRLYWYGGVFLLLLLQQRSKHPREMVITPKASTSLLAGGLPVCCFPSVVFPPCGVWLGLCVGRVDPALAFIRWDHLLSPRASARPTRTGSSLAAAGAPQLHSPAPPQQTRRQARRPADNTHFICCVLHYLRLGVADR